MIPQLNIPDNQLRKMGLAEEHIQAFNNVNKLTEKMLNSRTFEDTPPEFTSQQLRQKEHNERAIAQMEAAISNYENEINKTIRTMNTVNSSYSTQYEAYTDLSEMVSTKLKEVNSANDKVDRAENRKNIANRKLFYENRNMEIYSAIYYSILYLIWVAIIALIFISIANERFKKDVIYYAGIIVMIGYLPNIIVYFKNLIQ
jgi:chromosome segregation ATPase